MNKLWKKLLAITAVSLTISLVGLVISGPVFGSGSPDSPQCVDNGNGTVTDNNARLMWQKATDGPMNWDAAMSHASNMSLGGLSGWRLPTVDELKGLYNSSCKNMMDVKSSWDNYYWSATTFADNTYYAWRVYFSNGVVNVYYKSDRYYVRAVRAAQ